MDRYSNVNEVTYDVDIVDLKELTNRIRGLLTEEDWERIEAATGSRDLSVRSDELGLYALAGHMRINKSIFDITIGRYLKHHKVVPARLSQNLKRVELSHKEIAYSAGRFAARAEIYVQAPHENSKEKWGYSWTLNVGEKEKVFLEKIFGYRGTYTKMDDLMQLDELRFNLPTNVDHRQAKAELDAEESKGLHVKINNDIAGIRENILTKLGNNYPDDKDDLMEEFNKGFQEELCKVKDFSVSVVKKPS